MHRLCYKFFLSNLPCSFSTHFVLSSAFMLPELLNQNLQVELSLLNINVCWFIKVVMMIIIPWETHNLCNEIWRYDRYSKHTRLVGNIYMGLPILKLSQRVAPVLAHHELCQWWVPGRVEIQLSACRPTNNTP